MTAAQGQPRARVWRPGSPLVPGLGPLESALMLVLWRSSSPLKVAEVAERLDYSRPLAYSSVAAVLINLCGKGLVRRCRDHNCWRYRAARSPHAYLNELIQHMCTLISAAQAPNSTDDPDIVNPAPAQSPHPAATPPETCGTLSDTAGLVDFVDAAAMLHSSLDQT